MSNQIAAVREGLKAAMDEADLRAFTIVPERYTPPAVIIEPGDPYITLEGATFGGFIVHHRLIVIAGIGINEVTAADLDGRILKALDAVPDDHAINEVERPGRWDVNGQAHPAAVIRVMTEVIRAEEE